MIPTILYKCLQCDLVFSTVLVAQVHTLEYHAGFEFLEWLIVAYRNSPARFCFCPGRDSISFNETVLHMALGHKLWQYFLRAKNRGDGSYFQECIWDDSCKYDLTFRILQDYRQLNEQQSSQNQASMQPNLGIQRII